MNAHGPGVIRFATSSPDSRRIPAIARTMSYLSSNRGGLFRVEDHVHLDPEPYEWTIDEYVESFHGRSALSRATMTPTSAAAFDRHLRSEVAPYAVGERLALAAGATVTWGQPLTA